jgi:transglutaminase-like putative cysteine protease
VIRFQFSIVLNYDVTLFGTDFIFNIHAARTRHQMVVRENLQISQNVLPQMHVDPVTHSRFLRLKAVMGPLQINYDATVDITHRLMATDQIGEVWVANLPGPVLPYLYPSRYCQSDLLHRFAVAEFGHLPQGYSRVRAIRDWVTSRVKFQSNTSDSFTSAIDTLNARVGVCRDFAHLMIALCRAVNIPARFATGFDYGADPILGPPDFHAYVEVYLGHCWYIFDPSGTAIPMGFVRLGTGRDAADGAFATIFGGVITQAPKVHIEAVTNDFGQRVVPVHTDLGVSTDTD